MKRVLFFLYFFGIFFGANAQDESSINPMLENGFSLHFTVGSDAKQFGNFETDETIPDEFAKTSMGLELGNRWYISPNQKMGFAIAANWLDATYAKKTIDYMYDEINQTAVEVSLLQIGALGTFAFSKKMALDAYYNLRPTVIASLTEDSEGDSEAIGGFGATHAIGAAFRYKVFSVGVKSIFGAVKETLSGDESEEKVSVDNFQIKLGFKF